MSAYCQFFDSVDIIDIKKTPGIYLLQYTEKQAMIYNNKMIVKLLRTYNLPHKIAAGTATIPYDINLSEIYSTDTDIDIMNKFKNCGIENERFIQIR